MNPSGHRNKDPQANRLWVGLNMNDKCAGQDGGSLEPKASDIGKKQSSNCGGMALEKNISDFKTNRKPPTGKKQ